MFNICGPGAISRRDAIDDAEDVSLDHAYVGKVAFLCCHFAKVFDEIEDVGTVVHIILWGRNQVSTNKYIKSSPEDRYILSQAAPEYTSANPHPYPGILAHNAPLSVTM
jgi:hypothetical protein